MKTSMNFAVLRAMQIVIGKQSNRPPVFCIAKNQAPMKKNGGRPMFKQNRRQQIKKR